MFCLMVRFFGKYVKMKNCDKREGMPGDPVCASIDMGHRLCPRMKKKRIVRDFARTIKFFEKYIAK